MNKPLSRHELRVLDSSGDTKTEWDPNKDDEVAAARSVFDRMRGKGYRAFYVEGEGKGRRMDTFDPAASKLVMVPQLQGG